MWIVLLTCFQIGILIAALLSIIFDLRPKVSSDRKQLLFSKWVFYFGAFAAFFFSLGIKATLNEPAPKSTEELMICSLFGMACVFCTVLMVLQKNWRITYDDQVLVFRNWLRISKQYPCDQLSIRLSGKTTQILYENRKIAEWDPRLVNMAEDLEISRFLKHSNVS